MSMIPDKPPFKLLDILYKKEFILFVVLITILIINSNLTPYFLDLYNLIDSTFLFSEKAIIALTMTFVIIARQIDLSVASIIAVSSVVLGYTTSLGYDTWLVISLTLLSVLCVVPLMELSLLSLQFLQSLSPLEQCLCLGD